MTEEQKERNTISEQEYQKRVREYLQSPKSTDRVWTYVLGSLMDVAATMGLDLLDEQIFSEEELKKWRNRA